MVSFNASLSAFACGLAWVNALRHLGGQQKDLHKDVVSFNTVTSALRTEWFQALQLLCRARATLRLDVVGGATQGLDFQL